MTGPDVVSEPKVSSPFVLFLFLSFSKDLNLPFILILIEITPFSTQIPKIIRIKKKGRDNIADE